MLTLPNGYRFTFCCASGALGFDGNGYWWEYPFRFVGLLRPREFTIITKTLTFYPERGNLNMLYPWQCVRLAKGGAVNDIRLTNPGFDYWIMFHYPRAMAMGYDIIPSIAPFTNVQAATMVVALSILNIKAIQLNLGCPNIKNEADPIEIAEAARKNTTKPIIAKLGYDQIHLIPRLDPYVDAYEQINAMPWEDICPGEPSPLEKYGRTGSLSGPEIARYARSALYMAKGMTTRPIISGGGISTLEDVLDRERMGAAAFSIGTLFLRKPWEPNRIVQAYKRRWDRVLVEKDVRLVGGG